MSKRYEIDQTPISYDAPTLWQKLASLQARVHSVREDYRDDANLKRSGRINSDLRSRNELDARLNSIEAELGSLIDEARREK